MTGVTIIEPLQTASTERRNSRQIHRHHVFRGASALRGIAHWVPERVMQVGEIEASICAFDGSALELERRTGLREKRVCDPSWGCLDLAMKAVERLEHSGLFDRMSLPYDGIDAVIYHGVRREYEEPATAVLIQDRLGLRGAMAFDVSDACLGFTDAWNIADSLIAGGKIRMALLVAGEKITDLADRAVDRINEGADVVEHFASLTVGDGASAAIVGCRDSGERGINLEAGIRESYGEHSGLCVMKSFEGGMLSNPKIMFDTAFELFPGLVHAVAHELDWSMDDVEHFIIHQTSMRISSRGADVLGVPFERVPMTFAELGNIASVSLPLTLSRVLEGYADWQTRRFMSVGFGSGIGIGVFGLQSY